MTIWNRYNSIPHTREEKKKRKKTKIDLFKSNQIGREEGKEERIISHKIASKGHIHSNAVSDALHSRALLMKFK